MGKKRIAVVGTGYVGLSIATLLAQYHTVIAVDIIPEKIELLNQRRITIQDVYRGTSTTWNDTCIAGIEFYGAAN